MYKVFVDNIPIYFEKEVNLSSNLPNYFLPVLATENYEKLFEHLKELDRNVKMVVQSPDPFSTLLKFFSLFKYIEAAGGLVHNPQTDKYLFIKRNGYWDIPKGKLDKGEKIKAAALREVKEECGFQKLKLGELIAETYHTYFAYGKYHLKKTYWFSMESTEVNELKPEEEEGITELIWLKKEDWEIIHKNTFKSISEVLNSVKKA